MKRFHYWIVISMLFISTTHACSKSNTSIGGGETNWLRKCVSDQDCAKRDSCQCGICTESCQSSDDCSEVPGAAGCLVTESLDDGSCRVVAAGESDRGICVARCETDRDCNRDKDFKCVSGICTAIIDEKQSDAGDVGTTYGLVFPVTDAGVSFPLWLNDATDSYVSDTLPENPDASGSETFDDTFDPDFPQCPCTVDFEPGARAPTYEMYSGNDYGRPEWERVVHPEGSCGSVRTYLYLDSYFLDLEQSTIESRYQGLFELCLHFRLCVHDCQIDDNCPQPDSGTAIARCSTEGECYLECGSQKTCPEGMTCVHGQDYSACFWAQDAIKPGCPAYCEQDPMPRDCTNFCASLFVACDPDKGVSCCEGLICKAEGYCDQE